MANHSTRRVSLKTAGAAATALSALSIPSATRVQATDSQSPAGGPDFVFILADDLAREPSEVDNLADQHPDIVKDVSIRLPEWQSTLPVGPMRLSVGSNANPRPPW